MTNRLHSGSLPRPVLWRSRLVAALIVLAVGAGAVGCGGNDLVVGGTVRPTVLPTGTTCLPRDARCTTPAECCSGLCQAAVCSCVLAGGPCSANNTCCSNSCDTAIGTCN
jgi:insecticidal peptide